jgi:hypothetical protein
MSGCWRLETKVVRRNNCWLSAIWWRSPEVGTSREKIRSEGGDFRSEPVRCGGQDKREWKRES